MTNSAKVNAAKKLLGRLFMGSLVFSLSFAKALANQINFPRPSAATTCSGELCTLLSVTEERGRVLQQYDRYASLIKVPIEDGKVKLVQGIDHVDYMSAGCKKNFSVPKKFYTPIANILASIGALPKDDKGLPTNLTGSQMAILSLYATVIKQGENMDCPFPVLFKNQLPTNE